jgi:hypothetical protein
VIVNGSISGSGDEEQTGNGWGACSGSCLAYGLGYSEGAGKGKGNEGGTGYGFGSGAGNSSSGDSWEYDIRGCLSSYDPDDCGVPCLDNGTAKFPIVTEYVWADHYGRVRLIPFSEYLIRYSFSKVEAEHELAIMLLSEVQ